MKAQDPQPASPRTVKYDAAVVDALSIAYREAGDPQNPKLVLLHGFRPRRISIAT
jgi:hypothetical protein